MKMLVKPIISASVTLSALWRISRRRWRWFSAVLGFALAWSAMKNVAWGEVLGLLGRIDFRAILAIIAINVLMLPVMTARWWLLLRMLDSPVSMLFLCTCRTAANAVSYLTPGPHFGGEPLSVYLLHHQQGVSASKAATSVALDRLLELLASFVVLTLCLAGLSSAEIDLFSGRQYHYTVAGVLILFSGILVALFNGMRPVSRPLLLVSKTADKHLRVSVCSGSLLDTILQAETQAEALFRRHRSRLLTAGLLSFAHWAAIFAEFWLMSFFLDVTLSFWQMTALVAVARLAFFTPLPAGIGVLESALPWVTASLDLGSSLGVSLVLIIRLRDILFSLFGLGLTMKYLTFKRKVSTVDDIPGL